MIRALLITDDAHDEAILTTCLKTADLRVTTGRALEYELDRWSESPSDLILVALERPDWVESVEEIRRVVIVPVFVITDSLSDQVHSKIIDAGANYVFERPYSTRLIASYVRSSTRQATGVLPESLSKMRHEQVELDPARRLVHVMGKSPQKLTQLEFRLLHTLMGHRNQVMPTDTLVEHVWGYTGDGDRALVRGLINRLRKKVEDEPLKPKHIHTISGVGYSFGED